ncbi:recQ-mediated genome instability protein 1-like [Pecten maximus]|uniref:recQ-mediated genome instability protein 1-like n=1 Tax=Pecten maximus TaxID=6579 RepID=UPI001458E183|nr:recQ-mediated genome instability protein 1-like [Pecten maximus]
MTGAMICQTRSWLRAKSVLVPDDWLDACVEWITEENQGNTITLSRINELVFEQWLLADLHELGTHCLPNGLTEAMKYQLSGSYALQIDSMVDVGKSFYSQLQKLQGTENANAEVSAEASDQKPWEPKPSQMMMLNLTDGTSNIKGMEYKPITCLNRKLQPGTKVMVNGSVLCRRGVLFLTNNNLKVLGGEVDTLIEENTKIKVLQEALDSSMQSTGSTHRQEFSDTDIKPSKLSGRNSVVPRNNVGGSATLNRNQSNLGSSTARPVSSTKTSVNDAVLDEWDMEDLAMDEMMDELDSMEMTQPGNLNSNTSKVIPDKVTTSRGQSSTTAQNRNNNVSTTVPHNRNSSAHSGLYTNGLKEEKFSQPNHNENITLRNLIYESRSGSRKSSGEMPNRKRQKLSDSSNVQEASVLSNYDSMFNDEFEDDFEDIPSSIVESKGAKNSNTILKPASKSESDSCGISVGENAGEKVKKLLSPLETNSQNIHRSPVGIGVGISGKKSLFSNSTGTSVIDSAKNVAVKVEPPSPVSTVCPISGVDKRVRSDQITMDKFVRTPTIGQRSNKSPVGQNGNLAKKIDGQKKLTDFTLVKPCYGVDAEPFTYLAIVKKQLTPLDSVTFKVKAYISTLIGRLDSSGGIVWKLACKINDGSDSLDVDLSGGVLTSLIGFSAPDSMVMKKRAKHDPSIKDILVEGIQQCQQKLIELLCIMEIRTDPSKARPEVIALHEMTPSRINALRTRVTQVIDNK